MVSGIDNPKMSEVKTLQGLVHRFRNFRGFGEFAFNSIPAAVLEQTYH